ncbi:hypothetical protein HDU96_002675 [Phlyctochytrium bullatum]|nr:hypothetical protein HDU96_002675 [Phlyctochytrium bullatum]
MATLADGSGSTELALVAPDESAAAAASAFGDTAVNGDGLLLPTPSGVPAMMYHAAASEYNAQAAAAAVHYHAALTAAQQQAVAAAAAGNPAYAAYGANTAAAAAAAAVAAGQLHNLAIPQAGGSTDGQSGPASAAASQAGGGSSAGSGDDKVKKKRGPRQTSICHHGKRRSQCVQCYDEGTGGSTICKHRRQRYACRPCFDEGRPTNSLCVHRTIRIKCKECTPERPPPRAYRPRVKTTSKNGGSNLSHAQQQAVTAAQVAGHPQLIAAPHGFPHPLAHLAVGMDLNGQFAHAAHLQALSLAGPIPTPMTTPIVQAHTTSNLRARKGWSRLGKTLNEDEDESEFSCELCGSDEKLVVGPSKQVYCFDCHIKHPEGDVKGIGESGSGNGGTGSKGKRSGGGSSGAGNGGGSRSAQTPPDTPKRTRNSSGAGGGAQGSGANKRRRTDDAGQPVGARDGEGGEDTNEEDEMVDVEGDDAQTLASGRSKRKTVGKKSAANCCSECNATDLTKAFKDPSGEVVCERCYKYLAKRGYRAQPVQPTKTQPRRSPRGKAAEPADDLSTESEGDLTDSAPEGSEQAMVPGSAFGLPGNMPVPPYYLVWYPPAGAAAANGAGGAGTNGTPAPGSYAAWIPYYGGAMYPAQGAAAAAPATTDADATSSIPAAAAALLSLQQDPAGPSNAGSPDPDDSPSEISVSSPPPGSSKKEAAAAGAAAAAAAAANPGLVMPTMPFYLPGPGGIPMPLPAGMLPGAAGGNHPAIIALTPETMAAMSKQSGAGKAAVAAAAAAAAAAATVRPPNAPSSSPGTSSSATAVAEESKTPKIVLPEPAAKEVASGKDVPAETAAAAGALKAPPPLTAPASPVQDIKALAAVASASTNGDKAKAE